MERHNGVRNGLCALPWVFFNMDHVVSLSYELEVGTAHWLTLIASFLWELDL